MARLERAAAAVGLNAPPPDTAHQVSRSALAEQEAAVRLDWDGTSLAIVIRELPKTPPLTLATVREPHPGYPWKSAERKVFDRALGAVALAGAGEALFLDAAGHVAEAARFSVGWLDGDTMVFPPLAMNVLPSIGRERALELAPSLGLAVREARVSPGELSGCALFLANAVRGVVPVASLDGVTVRADSHIATLAQRFWP
jgi:branched-chain amino acid aminotransferase